MLKYKTMIHISLGSSCSVAYQLQQLRLRKEAYPFDWVRTPGLNTVVQLLKAKFDGFIDTVVQTSVSDKFPVSDSDDFPFDDNKISEKSIIMKNKYNVVFYHDFCENTNLDEIKGKYERRINRLYDVINGDNEICFVRDELKIGAIKISDIEEFIEVILGINKNAKFKIVVIVHNPSNKKNDIFNYVNERVKIVNDVGKFGGWTRDGVDWKSVFCLL